VRKTRSTAARTHAHKAFPRAVLQTNVARLAFRVVRTFLDSVRDGLLVFLVGVVLFGAATVGDLLTLVVVAAAVRVVAEASITAVFRFAGHASRRGVVLEGLRAGGAGRQNHFGFDLGA
jgi:hypothetical protein